MCYTALSPRRVNRNSAARVLISGWISWLFSFKVESNVLRRSDFTVDFTFPSLLASYSFPYGNLMSSNVALAGFQLKSEEGRGFL
ncbi:hypothetical protein L1887_18206 [Cichorium endivia]|nr:hypothetical protein L1887_18206 [Cichorium endivia]